MVRRRGNTHNPQENIASWDVAGCPLAQDGSKGKYARGLDEILKSPAGRLPLGHAGRNLRSELATAWWRKELAKSFPDGGDQGVGRLLFGEYGSGLLGLGQCHPR